MTKTRPGGKAGAARSGRDKEDDDTVTLSQTAYPDKDARCRGCGARAGALVRALDARGRPCRATEPVVPVEPVVLVRVPVLGLGDWILCRRCDAGLRRRARALHAAGAHD